MLTYFNPDCIIIKNIVYFKFYTGGFRYQTTDRLCIINTSGIN